MSTEVQNPPPERRFADELAWLAAWDGGARPPGWRLTPKAVVAFVCGASLRLPAPVGGLPDERTISGKFVGDRALVERAVITLAGERGLLLVGEPGTAKSMLSELIAAAVCGTSALVVQGTAGTSEEQLRYGWNYASLLARGPTAEALVPSPVLEAMQRGAIARVEEVTRCLPEVQDALVSILSDRRMAVPELGEAGAVEARPGFNVIATANLRDRGVSEMSAALKRRFNFENVPAIPTLEAELELVRARATVALQRAGATAPVDEQLLRALVTAFRDLRGGRAVEGWAVEKPSTVMSTAEAVGVATAIGLHGAFFGDASAVPLLPSHLLGVVLKDDPKDRGRLLAYWDGAVKRRAEVDPTWRLLYERRAELEEGNG
jgi:MoxR-like ATPase